MATQKKVVIIGGGFAGINLANTLSKSERYHITVVDKNNYHFFPPLLYQVATGFLDPSAICYPFRKLFRDKKNIHFRMAELTRINHAAHICELNNGELPYDYLVIAAGVQLNYFGIDNVQKNAIPMKTLDDAVGMKNTLLQGMEQACITEDAETRKKLLTVAICGGGPTGVEVAGMLAELRRGIKDKDYPELINAGAEIYLIEAGPVLLNAMSKQSQEAAYKRLTKLGVKILLNTPVKDFNNETVVLANGQTIQTRSMIWAAGISGQPFGGIPGSNFGRGKRIAVDPFNRVLDMPDVFAIGDSCVQTHDEQFPSGHPQLAQVAIQQGRNVGNNFLRQDQGKQPLPFKYNDKGSLAIVGRNFAVADLKGPIKFLDGFMALVIWLFVHLFSLLKHVNRVRTLSSWITTYLTGDQSLRLIIRPTKKMIE